ncbi:MAG: dihydropteroate synthase [Pseudomonadota bacterium]
MTVHWQTTRFRLDLTRPLVMGIVNVTPDSFSDGGHHAAEADGRTHCDRLLAEGADILDLGGESTRPGAPLVPADEEWRRLRPVLAHALTLGVPVSIDTWKPEVMARALAMGADIINDVHALETPGALQTVTAHPSCGVCLMHMRGVPADMQTRTRYADVVEDVSTYLRDRVTAVETAGVAQERLVLDPGIGFGKTVEQNFELLRRQLVLRALRRPLLVGWSRKSSLGVVTGRAVGERLAGSLAAALAAVRLGASIVRVHDVAATVDALKVWRAAGLVPPFAGDATPG